MCPQHPAGGLARRGQSTAVPSAPWGVRSGTFMQSILPQPAGFTQPRGPLLLIIQGGGKEQPALVLSWRVLTHATLLHTVLSSQDTLELTAGTHWCPLLPTIPESQPRHVCALGMWGAPEWRPAEAQSIQRQTWPNLAPTRPSSSAPTAHPEACPSDTE